MKLTAIANDHLSYRVRVHRTGCRDIEKDLRRGCLISDPEQDWTSREEFGLDYWSDVNEDHKGLRENPDGSDIQYVFEDILFLSCTMDMPVYDKKVKKGELWISTRF